MFCSELYENSTNQTEQLLSNFDDIPKEDIQRVCIQNDEDTTPINYENSNSVDHLGQSERLLSYSDDFELHQLQTNVEQLSATSDNIEFVSTHENVIEQRFKVTPVHDDDMQIDKSSHGILGTNSVRFDETANFSLGSTLTQSYKEGLSSIQGAIPGTDDDICPLCPKKRVTDSENETELWEWLLPESSVYHSQRLPCDCRDVIRYIHVECLDDKYSYSLTIITCPWCKANLTVNRRWRPRCKCRKFIRHLIEFCLLLAFLASFPLWSLIKNGVTALNGCFFGICVVLVLIFLLAKVRNGFKSYYYEIRNCSHNRVSSATYPI